MENENENMNTPHTWGELDFSNVAACELGRMMNMINQRLSRLEQNTTVRNKAGKLVTLEDLYLEEAAENRTAPTEAPTEEKAE